MLREGRLALDKLDLRIEIGQHTAILGANGSGKSTLVQLIARELYAQARPEQTASVRLFGRERWNVAELRRQLGIVSPALQTAFAQDGPVEVLDAVISGFFAARGTWINHRVTDAMREKARAALDALGATHLIGRPLGQLSTGEARRVLIARALVFAPRALLLDEPCAGLDLASRRRFLNSLRPLARAGTTVLLVTHHVEEVLPEINHVVLLREGRVLAQGNKATVLNGASLSAAFGAAIEVRQRGAWYHAALAG